MTVSTTPRHLLTIREVADRLGIGRTHAYHLVWRGSLPSLTIGRCRRIASEDLEVFVGRLRSEAAASAEHESAAPGDGTRKRRRGGSGDATTERDPE